MRDDRETIGYEVVIRFFPGAPVEAHRFFNALEWDNQVDWMRLDRVVIPHGEDRVHEATRARPQLS